MEMVIVNSGIYACVVLMCVTVVFVLAQLRHDNSLMDIAYGPVFFLSAIITLLLTHTSERLPILIVIALGLWSVRLSVRIFRKNFGKPEDARYAAWRTAWTKRGETYFILRSFVQINLLQGVVIVCVALPFIIAVASPTSFSWPFVVIGSVVFLIGLGMETLADWQLDDFIARKKSSSETANLMTTGLFRYSRRPNYFGETLIWWGLAIMVLPLPFGIVALISPLLITYIVTKVTGPMLEKIFLEKYPEEYRAYMRRTSYFVPLPPKQSPL